MPSTLWEELREAVKRCAVWGSIITAALAADWLIWISIQTLWKHMGVTTVLFSQPLPSIALTSWWCLLPF